MVKKILIIFTLALAALASLGYLQYDSNRTLKVSANPDVGGKIAYAVSGSIWIYADGKSQQLTHGPKGPY